MHRLVLTMLYAPALLAADQYFKTAEAKLDLLHVHYAFPHSVSSLLAR